MKTEPKARNIKIKNEKISRKKGNKTLIIGIAVAVLLAGIAYAAFFGSSITGDETKTKKSSDRELKLPSYVYTNPITLKAYTYATAYPEILEQIPCYCGCVEHGSAGSNYQPHRFNRDCFINDKWEYDDHAAYCDICIGIAIKVQNYLASGMTLKEARAKIDAEYSVKGLKGTNTPPVRDDYKPILSPKSSITIE